MALDLARLRAEAHQAAICLDFDGTLAPIVEDPEAAVAPTGTTELLARLAARYAAVALVSGRPAAFLAERVPAPGVRHVGLYAMEEVLDGEVHTDPAAEAYRLAVQAALHDLRAHPAVTGSGAWLEDKGLAAGVHLRRVSEPERWAGPVEQAAAEVARAHGLALAPGKLVYELRPPIERDKGDAVRRVVAESGARLVMMAGDDLGDLAAFEALDELERSGHEGLKVAVRSAESPAALLQAADLVVDGPEGVRELLGALDRL
jgi:trehalose 6-phosphate phosphatase